MIIQETEGFPSIDLYIIEAEKQAEVEVDERRRGGKGDILWYACTCHLITG
jgi:hypothetical protein